MTINEAYLVALKTTVISTYIPVMNPGLYDTFPESFPGYIGQFPGHLLTEILFLTVDWSRKPSDMPRKRHR